jgi:hypothetical protein
MSNRREDLNFITRSTCDTCNTTSTGVMFHCNGTPVLFQCRTCNPKTYETYAQLQIDTWLRGGLATNDYVVTPEHLRALEESAAQG